MTLKMESERASGLVAPIVGLILDSSTVIQAERQRSTVGDFLEEIRGQYEDSKLAISVVTLAELVHGVERAQTESVRVRRRAFIDELKAGVQVLPLTERAAEIAGSISGKRAAEGIVLPFEDLLIAATALEFGYGVATRNPRHFSRVPGVTVVETS